jgi:AI-2 transport system substrate-binding protein
MNRISKIMAAMMALVLCVAMVTVATAEGINVVFIPKLSGNAFFESANVGAQDFAALNGFTVTYDGNPEASAANQVAIVQNAITSGADAICISTVDAAGVNDALKEAAEAGLVVTTWDSDSLPESRSIMVSQGTPEQLGVMLVDMLAASLTERGKDVTKDAIKYVWHYSQATVTDQNSWHVAGEVYVAEKYPNWINVFPDNYYSEQDAEKAITVGESILSTYPDIDGIICNDSTALPGQAQAAQNLGLDATKVSITGFAAPNSMKDYCRAGILTRWGLWDCKIQGALGCYMAYLLASGQEIKVGDTIDVPGIGAVTVEPNTVLDPNAFTSETSGVVLLPERAVFTIENMDNYNF